MDQSKYINTYIETIVNTLIEYMKSNLQLQTQVKVNEFVVAEKDQTINSLNQQLSENKVAEDWKAKYEAAETNYSAILAKLNHMNTLLAQVGDMKKIIIEKDAQIDLLQKEIDELKNPKKVINTKIKKKEEALTTVLFDSNSKQEKSTDDF